MRIDIDYKVVSGEWKGRLVTAQVAEAIGRAVGRIGVYSDSRDAELFSFIDSISFRCHGNGFCADVVAVITLATPSASENPAHNYRCLARVAEYRLGRGAPVEDFGEEILDAVAEAVKFKRVTKLKS